MHTGNQIRERFLKYFENHAHARVASSSLLPQNDPTLFFTNAGMVQFKDVFTGREDRPYKTATTSQKCMRVSGKHNDLENVGRTPRHHTFFEMLGNFSFGDYFKSKAIAMAWEFLTVEVKIPKEWLWITIFETDDEAGDIWHKEVGIPRDRIVKCGEKDNFWSMGETGPCGPCSEIFVDLKQLHGEGVALGTPATNDDDFMEIWNLVFMQFNRDAKGSLTPLPKPSIDTGMGLERLCTVLQKAKSNYDTDLFLPLIRFFASRTGKEYLKDSETDVSLRVMADHIRATVFLIADGVLPSNEGRGYVLRRIMRRAIRHGRILGMKEPFFYQAVETLVREMGEVYPDIKKNQGTIEKVIRIEEERFLETLEKGLVLIEEELASGKKSKSFDGALAFKLYDTYGFPVDLTQLIVEEKGLNVDMTAFDSEMAAQKKRARAAWKGSGAESVGDIYHALVREGKTTRFIGYEHLDGQATVGALLKDGVRVEEVVSGDDVEVFVDVTPFYAESGGQAGDVGTIDSKAAKLEVVDTRKPVDKIFSHRANVVRGTLKVGDKVSLTVSTEHRRPIMINHTATHILHAALRETLGEHVRQAGSLVESEKLRFDFNHYEALTAAQIEAIERRVNGVILANYTVTKEEMSQEQAKTKGALAFFGDKYGDRVRVVTVGPYSMEFCGGTHLNASGEIGLLKIVSESSVAAGVRRIEAVTGAVAFAQFQKIQKELDHLAGLFKSTPDELPARVKKANDRIKELEREVAALKTKMASGGGAGGSDYLTKVKEVRGVRILPLETDIDDAKALREFADQVKQRLKSGIAVIASKSAGKVSLLVTVSPDLIAKYQAGKLIGQLAGLIGGKGGGRPDMAQAGGTLPDKIPEVFLKLEELL